MRFIHTADIHLGAGPAQGKMSAQSRKKEIWDSFRAFMEAVKQEDVDLLLIAGDLFHGQPLKSELREVNYLFSQLSHTQIVLMAGNHDCLRKHSFYRDFPWALNVTFFEGEEVSRVYLPQIDTYVYGHSYPQQEIKTHVYDTLQPGSEPGYHILLAHGGDEKHIPIDFKALAAAGFDYVALGHIHKPALMPDRRMAYPGALEPINRLDYGTHGYITGKLGRDLQIHFVPFARRSYLKMEIITDEELPQSMLEDQINEQIQLMGVDNYYCLHLMGSYTPQEGYDRERLMNIDQIVAVEDDTQPSLDYKLLYRQYEGTIIGDYLEQFSQANGVRKKALQYGLLALLETKG